LINSGTVCVKSQSSLLALFAYPACSHYARAGAQAIDERPPAHSTAKSMSVRESYKGPHFTK
ncbi:unnamed protein product, partial [Amoebophrya sp. A120]